MGGRDNRMAVLAGRLQMSKPDLDDRRLAANVLVAQALKMRNEAAAIHKLSGRPARRVQELLHNALKIEQTAEWIKT